MTTEDNPPPDVERLRNTRDGKFIAALMAGIAPAIADHVAKAVHAATTPLNTRIAELEARPSTKYLGVWREGKVYGPGNMLTHDGSLWHCNRSCMSRPGTSNEDWTLAVKRGRDAR